MIERSQRSNLFLPLLFCESWMFVKENSNKKKASVTTFGQHEHLFKIIYLLCECFVNYFICISTYSLKRFIMCFFNSRIVERHFLVFWTIFRIILFIASVALPLQYFLNIPKLTKLQNSHFKISQCEKESVYLCLKFRIC